MRYMGEIWLLLQNEWGIGTEDAANKWRYGKDNCEIYWYMGVIRGIYNWYTIKNCQRFSYVSNLSVSDWQKDIRLGFSLDSPDIYLTFA